MFSSFYFTLNKQFEILVSILTTTGLYKINREISRCFDSRKWIEDENGGCVFTYILPSIGNKSARNGLANATKQFPYSGSSHRNTA